MDVEFEGKTYHDDRLFVLGICKCTIREVDAETVETVIYHEDAPANHIWCIVTVRNTARYPMARVDHFATEEEAHNYMRHVEPTTPRVSLGGASPVPPPTYDEFVAWKAANHLEDYDYRKLYARGGTNPRELVLSRRQRQSR